MMDTDIEIKREIEEVDLISDSEPEDVKSVIKMEFKEEMRESPVIFEPDQQNLDVVEAMYKCDHCGHTTDNFCDYQAHYNKCICTIIPDTNHTIGSDTNPNPRSPPLSREGKLNSRIFKECPVCRELCRANHYKRHVAAHAAKSMRLICDACGMKFQTTREVTRHRRMSGCGGRKKGKGAEVATGVEGEGDEGVGVGPYQCPICERTFATATSHKGHVRAHKKQFQCEVCLKVYHLASELKEHSREHERGVRFECEFCDEYFSRPYYLKVHTRLHTGKGLSSCSICNMVFPLASLLTQHLGTKKHEKRVQERREKLAEERRKASENKVYERATKRKETVNEVRFDSKKNRVMFDTVKNNLGEVKIEFVENSNGIRFDTVNNVRLDTIENSKEFLGEVRVKSEFVENSNGIRFDTVNKVRFDTMENRIMFDSVENSKEYLGDIRVKNEFVENSNGIRFKAVENFNETVVKLEVLDNDNGECM